MPKTCPCVMQPCRDGGGAKRMFFVLPSPHTPVRHLGWEGWGGEEEEEVWVMG
jgi:hypothetical protein